MPGTLLQAGDEEADASCFILSERAVRQARSCVLQQFETLRAEFLVALFPAAIEADHLFYGALFLGNA